MKKICSIGDIRIEYSESGKNYAPVMLFVHGLGANLEQFANQQDFFSDKYRVITVNLPGHGESTLTEGSSLSDFADSILILMDNLGVKNFHFIGNSMGGNVGYQLIDRCEANLLSFTTFGTTSELHVPTSTTTILLAAYKLLSINAIAKLASSAGRTAEAKLKIQSMMRTMDKQNLLVIVPMLADFNLLNVIGASSLPTMILKGGKDSDINRTLNSTISAFEERGNFTLKSIAEAGHFVNLDCPAEFNKALSDFIDNIGV